jgi:hypothetical protein
MAKTVLYGGIFVVDDLKGYLQAENTSICQLLYFADLSDIARHIESTRYTGRNEHLRYPVEAMLKLMVVKQFRYLGYDKTVASLTQEEAWLLGFEEGEGIYKVPSGSTLHHFVKYRLGVEGIDEIMEMVGKKLVQAATSKKATTDSTPLEASRYDKHADYNPHYQCKMYKGHITMVGTLPVYMSFTEGNANDSPELFEHIMALKSMKASVGEYFLDGAYDSFRNHADIWYHLSAIPKIYCGENAVINPEGSLERIDHWVNKMWKLGGSIHMSLEEKLRFLYEHGREDQVGAYFRNQNLEDVTFDVSYQNRKECERINGHIKETVKFDVRGVPNPSKELYTKLSFVAYQMLLLTNIQNDVTPENSFGKFF